MYDGATQAISSCVAPRLPGHLRQRDVDDGGVEHLHHRRRDQAEEDEPAVLRFLRIRRVRQVLVWPRKLGGK